MKDAHPGRIELAALSPATGGKAIRLGRLFNPDSRRTLIIAYAHGVLMGALPGMLTSEQIGDSVSALADVEGILVTPGIVRHTAGVFAKPNGPSMLMLVDWQNVSRPLEQLGYAEGACEQLIAVEDAAAHGADGVMTYLYLGYSDPTEEARDIKRNAEVAGECRRLGLVHIIESRAIKKERLNDGTLDPAIVRLHTRIAAELGADIVKTKYTGDPESFATVVEQCPVPVVVAGGALKDHLQDSLDEARGVVEAGAAGLMFGRNIYQQPDIASALKQFRDVVHGP